MPTQLRDGDADTQPKQTAAYGAPDHIAPFFE